MKPYSEEACAEYMKRLNNGGDGLLQFWRTDTDVLKHVENLCPALPDGSAVLDIGCGTGQFLHVVNLLYPQTDCYGVNVFRCQVENCKNPNLHLFVGDIEEHDEILRERKYQTVFCHYTFGHLTSTEILTKVYAGLKPDGSLILWDIAPKRVDVRSVFGYRLTTRSVMEKLLQKAGFVVTSKIWAPIPAPGLCTALTPEEVKVFQDFTVPVLYVATKV